MKALIRTGLAVAVLALGACGGGDDDDNGGDDQPNMPDAAVTPDAAACLAESTINATPTPGQAGNSAVLRVPKQAGGGTQLIWNLVVSPDGSPLDLIQFVVDEPVTLNTPLQLVQACTDQTTYCWILLADATVVNGAPDSDFIMYPDTGTITITEAGPTGTGKFKATVSESLWTQYAGSPPMPVEGGCSTTLGAMTVDLPIEAPPMGKPAGRGPLESGAAAARRR
jgi:hypothetical protein